MKTFHILFVCMGNICRSPTAEGVMRKLIKNKDLQSYIKVDSAGTHDYHVSEPPDIRAQVAAENRGYVLSDLRARQISPQDFEHFDLLLAMDKNNLMLLQAMCPPEYRHKVRLLMSYARHFNVLTVPDPYGRSLDNFELVLDYIQDACAGLMQTILEIISKSSEQSDL